MKRHQLSRRTFLKGCIAGATVSLGLPTLESMLDDHGAFADGTEREPFFGLFYWANGTPWHAAHGQEQALAGHPDLWTPATIGPGYTPSELLAPLAPFNVSVLSGLEPHTEILPSPAGQGDGHMRGFMVAMTGDRPQPETFDHSSHTLTSLGPSLDQRIAKDPNFYPMQPRFRSLEVGVSTARFHEYGHWNAISYNGPNSQNLPISDPGALYDRLFSAPADAAVTNARTRLLDAVLDDARSLRSRLGSNDRQRLDAHLEHVSSIQNRLNASAPYCEAPVRPNNEGDLIAKTGLMADLLAVAIDCGLTRVFSFMLTSPASTHIFSNLGVPDGMHKICHDGFWQEVRDITEYQMQAFARLLQPFNVPDPSGATLLDRGLIYGTSEYGEGWKHSVKELPVVLAGGANGRIARGVHARDPGGNLAKAQLTALQALGLNYQSFGFNGAQTTETISGILV